MSNLVFTLYEADSDHLADIYCTSLTLEDAIVEATNLVAESDVSVFGATTPSERYEGIRQDWFAFETGMDDMDASIEGHEEDSRRMGWLCEWLNLRMNGQMNGSDWQGFDGDVFYRYFFTEGVEE